MLKKEKELEITDFKNNQRDQKRKNEHQEGKNEFGKPKEKKEETEKKQRKKGNFCNNEVEKLFTNIFIRQFNIW